MKLVEQPEVFLIAEPQIRTVEMERYLRAVGGEAWFERVYRSAMWGEEPPPAEGLIEFAGRLCYKSWEPGLNKNVTKIREDRGEYLLNVLRSGHGSVLEHAWFSFVIHNCSRVLTAELNRHRVGTAISEQSLRYVRLDDLPFRPPPNLSGESQMRMIKAVEGLEATIRTIMDQELDEGDPFTAKKIVTSAVRRIAPLGVATEQLWSANVRTLRLVIEKRSDVAAEEEIRIFAQKLYKIMAGNCPLLFGDYEQGEDGMLRTEFKKV